MKKIIIVLDWFSIFEKFQPEFNFNIQQVDFNLISYFLLIILERSFFPVNNTAESMEVLSARISTWGHCKLSSEWTLKSVPG